MNAELLKTKQPAGQSALPASAKTIISRIMNSKIPFVLLDHAQHPLSNKLLASAPPEGNEPAQMKKPITSLQLISPSKAVSKELAEKALESLANSGKRRVDLNYTHKGKEQIIRFSRTVNNEEMLNEILDLSFKNNLSKSFVTMAGVVKIVQTNAGSSSLELREPIETLFSVSVLDNTIKPLDENAIENMKKNHTKSISMLKAFLSDLANERDVRPGDVHIENLGIRNENELVILSIGNLEAKEKGEGDPDLISLLSQFRALGVIDRADYQNIGKSLGLELSEENYSIFYSN
ncbi:MAG: hypothetical protein ABIH83_03065 [Candidatus Micrarchaeota archaeon]